MASTQLRNLTDGARFTMDGRDGEVLNVNDSEVKVKVETAAGGGQYQTALWAPGTEVKAIPQYAPRETTPKPAATASTPLPTEVPTSSPSLPQNESEPISVARRPPKTQEAPRGRKAKAKVTTATKEKPKSKNGKDLGKKNGKLVNKINKGDKGNGKPKSNGHKNLRKKASPKAKKELVPQPKFPALQGLSRAGALRWMGSKGYTAAEAEVIFDKLKIPVALNTLVSQISSGRNYKEGGFQGDVPKLKKEQADALKTTCERHRPKTK